MKGIVIVLVLLNIVYAGWQFSGIRSGEGPQQASVEPEKKTLLLRAEQDAIDLVRQAEKEKRLAAEKNNQKAAKSVKEKARISKPAPTRPISSKSASGVARAAPQACYAIGPFLLASDVARLAKQIESTAITVQQRATAERKQVGVWVYIPPAETLQDAREILRQLKDKDIDDALIISEGAKANAISTGVYHVNSRAEARKVEIKAIGYNAVIEPLHRTQPQYWLDLELFNQSNMPKRIWQRLRNEFPEIGQQKRPCGV